MLALCSSTVWGAAVQRLWKEQESKCNQSFLVTPPPLLSPNSGSDNTKMIRVRIISCILDLLSHFKLLALYFAFAEQICQSVGRKAANPLNGVTLMNSLLCQTFFAEIRLKKRKKEKRKLEDEGRMRGGRWIYHRQVAVPLELWIMHSSSIRRKWEIEFTLTG